jgi:hypothetical protein
MDYFRFSFSFFSFFISFFFLYKYLFMHLITSTCIFLLFLLCVKRVIIKFILIYRHLGILKFSLSFSKINWILCIIFSQLVKYLYLFRSISLCPFYIFSFIHKSKIIENTSWWLCMMKDISQLLAYNRIQFRRVSKPTNRNIVLLSDIFYIPITNIFDIHPSQMKASKILVIFPPYSLTSQLQVTIKPSHSTQLITLNHREYQINILLILLCLLISCR